MSYLRAVAYLRDGLFAEDLVFLNPPPGLDRIRVDFVELFTSVVDRRGQPVLDLTREELRVIEEGAPQTIRRFERVADLPIHATVALDISTSMRPRIHAVGSAAQEFVTRLIGPKDRAAVVAFNDRPELLVPFTADQEELSSGLDGLLTEGRTALFDTVVFALYNFGGITGKRALVLFSDGADTASKYTFETARDYARHSGVAIYTIALQVKTSDLRSRLHLEHLATETGGRSFFIDDLFELEDVYSKIETELRSQYLVAYQSSAVAGLDFRRVKVEIDRPDHSAKTIPGYYP
jgi:Ca-activated chloride channel family protein